MAKFFDKIKLKDVILLIDLLHNNEITSIGYIKSKFNNAGENFIGIMNLLEALDIVFIEEDNIFRTNTFKEVSQEILGSKVFFSIYILDHLNFSNHEVFTELKTYLQNFHLIDTKLGYKPKKADRLAESGVRNFLIELGIVIYESKNDIYVIDESFFSTIFNKTANGKKTLSNLEEQLEKNRIIGEKAELEILVFERNRLNNFPDLIKQLIHVSKKCVNAGYDIQSCEIQNNENEILYRFIEVKAVAKNDFKFFWTRNEIKTAKKLGERYFLYLLPVLGDDCFDLSEIKIIQNAYKEIFIEHNDWIRTEELFSFKKPTLFDSSIFQG